ncbi:pfs domain-containing protein [Trichoderma evansii]
MALPRLSDPQRYTVGLITALDNELAAATAVLDQEHRRPQNFTKHAKDTNTYTWGQIGDHNVVIASLAAGSYGTVSAATTAMSMISSLPHLRFGLMVGIGAGIPRLAEEIDIRLGDVVVSHPIGTSPGVVQYDLGKLRSEGKIERVGHLSAPPEVLLKGLQALKARHFMVDSQIPDILEEMIQRYPKMKQSGGNGTPGFIHQGIQNDRLFEASSIHKYIPNPHSTSCTQDRACNDCDSTREIKRQDRSSDPMIHYGIIASGDLVIKDGVSRDEILHRLDEKCICFEMEAAGLMNSFPCLVIRGICDYADTHKNDRWYNYAAATAAAFAKELLYTMDGEDVKSAPPIEEVIKRLSDEVARMADSNKETHSIIQTLDTNHHLKELRDWLKPPDQSENYNKALKERHGSSGQWFLHSSEYSSWKSQPNSFLWLQGIPGCGKTILSSTIIEDLEDKRVQNLLYFFFDFTKPDKQLFNKALSSLVVQLYCKNEATQRYLDLLYDGCGKQNSQPSVDALYMTLQNMLQQAGEVHIILDALDECKKRKEYPTGGLLTSIKALATPQQTNIRLLVTSRPEQDIMSSIESWARNQDIIPIQSEKVADDIRAYIKERVRDNKGMERWSKQPEIQDEIETELSNKANGMFRWVACQLDALEDCCDYPLLRNALSSLPKDLDETYSQILANLPREHEHYTRRLLQFLLFSERPLTIKEAVDIIAVDMATSPRFDPKNRMPVPMEIARYCSSLAVLTRKNEEATQELQLAHMSVKDYLLSNKVQQRFAKDFEEVTARASIAQVCLAYLLELGKIPRTELSQHSYWLAQYSAQYWMDHAAIGETGGEQVCALIADFFACEGAQKNCYMLCDPDIPFPSIEFRIPSVIAPPIYYASLGGLYSSVRLLLDKNANINARDGRWGNALQAASHKGHDRIVQMLLDKNVDVNAQGGEHGNALQAASHKGHDRIVQMLLDKNADVNAQGGYLGNALQAASYKGHEKIVQMLLDKNADINAQSGYLGNALQAASYEGHDRIVQMLLDKNADMLLDKNADVNAQGGIYGNALCAASYQGCEKIVQMLLDKNADVNAQGSGYPTALQIASVGGHKKIVQMLLDKVNEAKPEDEIAVE